MFISCLLGLWLRVSTKFSSTKASSSTNALFACFSASFVAFGGPPLLVFATSTIGTSSSSIGTSTSVGAFLPVLHCLLS